MRTAVEGEGVVNYRPRRDWGGKVSKVVLGSVSGVCGGLGGVLLGAYRDQRVIPEFVVTFILAVQERVNATVLGMNQPSFTA